MHRDEGGPKVTDWETRKSPKSRHLIPGLNNQRDPDIKGEEKERSSLLKCVVLRMNLVPGRNGLGAWGAVSRRGRQGSGR